jgi:hypothetical protein
MAIQTHRFRLRGPHSEHLSREAGVAVTRQEPTLSTDVVYEDYDVDSADLQALIDVLSVPGCGGGSWEHVGQV